MTGLVASLMRSGYFPDLAGAPFLVPLVGTAGGWAVEVVEDILAKRRVVVVAGWKPTYKVRTFSSAHLLL